MMTQEEWMDVQAMRRQGLTYKEIGEATGYHPATIAKWDRLGGPPAARVVAVEDRVVDPVWADRLTELLVGNSRLLATSLFDIIRAEGFTGSYPTVARWVNEQRGPRFPHGRHGHRQIPPDAHWTSTLGCLQRVRVAVVNSRRPVRLISSKPISVRRHR